MAAVQEHIRFRRSSPKSHLAIQVDEQRAADLATLEDPKLPDSMHETARKRLRRLERERCRIGPQMILPTTTDD